MQARLKEVISNLELNIPESVFNFDLDRQKAEEYLREHPEVPFIIRLASIDGYFTIDIPYLFDKTQFRRRLVLLPTLDETKFMVGLNKGADFVKHFELKEFLTKYWKPHYKCMAFDKELAQLEKNAWAQCKLRLPHSQENKIAVLSTQSLGMQKIALTPEQLDNYAKQNPKLQQAGDGHTGFAMALALNAPFVVVRSDGKRDESNAVLQKHVGDNGVILVTGHSGPGLNRIQGNYEGSDSTKHKIKRTPQDIVSTTMDAGLKNGHHITVLLCICYGALSTSTIADDSFANKLARAFATEGISSTILASDKSVRRFGTNAIKDATITFNDTQGMGAKDIRVFETKVDGPNLNPHINIYRPDETIQLGKNGVSFLNANDQRALQVECVDHAPQLPDFAGELTKKSPIIDTMFCAAAAGDFDFFQTFLDGYPEEEWLPVFSEVDESGDTVLHYVMRSPELVERVLTLLPREECLQKLLVENLQGVRALDCAIMVPNSLKIVLQLLSKEEVIPEIERNNYNPLFLSAKYPESLELLLTLYPEKGQHAVIQKRDNDDKTLLHHAAKSFDSIQVIFRRYTEEERFKAVQCQDSKGKTPLFYAFDCIQALSLLLSLHPIEERFVVVEAQNLLFYAKRSVEFVRAIVSLLHENDWKKILIVKEKYDRDGMHKNAFRNKRNFLSQIAHDIKILAFLQELIPAKYWLAALQEGSENNESALHIGSVESLLSIFAFLPEYAQLAAVQTKDKDGKTILHRIVFNPDLCCQILLYVPKAYRFAVIQIKDRYNQTIAHYLNESFEGLKKLLDLLPDDDKLPTLQLSDSYHSLLHLSSGGNQNNSSHENNVLLLESIKQKLSLLPKNDYLQALLTEDSQGGSIFHPLCKEPVLLQELITLLPTHQRFPIVQKFILRNAYGNPDLFKMVLSVLPKDIIKMQSYQGKTLFHYIAKRPESLQLLLPYYTKEELLDALQVKDSTGSTPLHYAIDYARSFEIMFNCFSEEKQQELIENEDDMGNTLPFYISTAESIKAFLNRYPETQRLRLVQHKNKQGECLLSHKRPVDFIGAILSCLPTEDRFRALQTKSEGELTLLEMFVKIRCFHIILLEVPPEDTNLELYCDAMRVICLFNTKYNQNANAFFSVTTNVDLSSFVMTSSEMVKKNLTSLLLENHNGPTLLQMKLVKKLGEFTKVTKDNYSAKRDKLLQEWEECNVHTLQ